MISGVIEKIDPEFGPYTILFNKEIQLKKVCYFAGHSIFEEYLDYIYDYLKRIGEIGYEIIFISSSPLNVISLSKLKGYCSVIIQKTNAGVDFGAWKIGLSEMDYARGYDALILANDSVFGPMRSIKKDADRLSAEYDLWGYSISLEQAIHVQSYFLACNKKMIDSGYVRNFWQNVKLMDVKEDWITAYEVGFSQAAIRNGFTIGAMADARILKDGLNLPSPYLNYTIAAWKELIVKYHFPVLKREVLIKDIAQATNAGWGDVISTVFPEYPLRYIDDYLKRYQKEVLDKGSIAYSTSFKDIICITHLTDKVTKDQLCTLSLGHQIARSLDQPLLCYQLTTSRYHPLLDAIDAPSSFHYIGSLDNDLLEQYIYHWNRFNVRALIIDRDTYRLFNSYFQNFYSGNIWVVSAEGKAMRISYFIRAEKIDDITIPMSESDLLSDDHYHVDLKCDKSFLDSYEYAIIRMFADNNAIRLNWQDSQLGDTGPDKGHLSIEFTNYNFQLFSRGKEIYFTEEAQDLCMQLEMQLKSHMHEEVRIIEALESPFVELKELSRLYQRCFSHPEQNVFVTPTTTSSFVHFYYEDSLHDLLPYIYNLTYLNDHRFFFSISEETSNRHKIAAKLYLLFPGCRVQIVKNTGKDIGGKLNLLKLYFELNVRSDYMLLLHDKKSLHSWAVEGNQWRVELFKVAEPHYISQILSLFANAPKIGIIGNKKWLNKTDFDYSNGRFAFHDAAFKKRLKEYGISISNYEFIAGTMFWIKEELMRAFFSRYSFLDLLEKLEHGNILDSKESTETHFLERFFGWFATAEGFELAGV